MTDTIASESCINNQYSPFYIFATYSITSCIVFLIILFILLIVFLLPPKPKKQEQQRHPPIKSHHVVITGGSSGIGLAIAKHCALHPETFSHITLIARNLANLQKASATLSSLTSAITISIHSADVSDYDSISGAIAEILKTTPSKNNPPTLLFNVAGKATASPFLATPPAQFSHLLSVNYLGSVYATRALLPHMPPGSTVVLTSSAAGQVGIFGYTAYAPTKFALRGFAEALAMEVSVVKDVDVWVQLAFPPDTDTPGYETENVGKPVETRLISEEAGLFQPEEIAKKMVAEALARKRFFVYFSLDTWMLSTLTAGMSGVSNVFDAMCQVCLMSLLRLVSLFYLASWRSIIQRCREERDRDGGDVGGDVGVGGVDTEKAGKKE